MAMYPQDSIALMERKRSSGNPIELSPGVILFTGLSGAGKTTLAAEVARRIRELGFKAEHLDGDAMRKVFPQTGFSRDERNLHLKRVGYFASLLARNGIF